MIIDTTMRFDNIIMRTNLACRILKVRMVFNLLTNQMWSEREREREDRGRGGYALTHVGRKNVILGGTGI